MKSRRKVLLKISHVVRQGFFRSTKLNVHISGAFLCSNFPFKMLSSYIFVFCFFFNKISDCMFTRCSHPCQMQRTCFLGIRAFCWRCDATKKPKQMRARGPNWMFFTPSPKPQRMLQQTWIYFKYQFKVPEFPEKTLKKTKNSCTSDSTQILHFYWLPCATGTLASD